MEIGFALIGAGNIGEVHACNLQAMPGARLVVATGRDENKLRAFGDRHDCETTTSIEQAISRADVNAALICTPSATHAEAAVLAAARGKHLLVEKPLDTTLAAADRIISAATAHRVRLGVFFQKRMLPCMQFLKHSIHNGQLGDLTAIEVSMKWYRTPGYYAAVPTRGTLAADGGGALMSQGIHFVDLLIWLFGMPTSVFAHSGRTHHSIEAEDTLTATLRFKSGTLGTLQATTAAYPHLTDRIEICGTQGCAVVGRGALTFFHTAERGEEIPPYGLIQQSGFERARSLKLGEDRGHYALLEDFVEALHVGRPPAIDGAEGRRSLELINALYRSARSGIEITP